MRDVTERWIFGVVLSYTYLIEFPKRGLPHSQVVFTLRPKDEITDAAAIDEIISAEIRDSDVDPDQHVLIVRQYVHTPCSRNKSNANCMRNDKCSKRLLNHSSTTQCTTAATIAP